MNAAPRVALSQDFLLKLARLPSAVHGRVFKWALKFQQDPTANGINYETIKGARDPNLRSVRIDQDWRGIVCKPERGDLYLLLHVDKHDAAYRWAESRKIAVNPATGALQIMMLEEVTEQAPTAPTQSPVAPSSVVAKSPPPAAAAKSLFEGIGDAELTQLGVPPELIPRVRKVADESSLDALQPALPVEAYEGLFLLAAGDSVSQILAQRETRVDRAIDTSDFAAALETPESQSRFVVVTNDAEMTAILNAPLSQWRVFLHPVQRKLAEGDRSGPVRILGGAGTGKTVVAMHRVRWLAKNRASADQKVLFTTFTRNLALDVEQNLKSLFLEDPALALVEVTNLDRWVHAYLRRRNYDHRIIYQRDDDAWGRAMQVADSSLGLDDQFYIDEWEQVVAGQGVLTRDDYRRVSRIGRKSVLTRDKRDRAWPVFEEYRDQLRTRRVKYVEDAYSDAAALLKEDPSGPRYCGIVIDETQDFGAPALKLLRAMIKPGPNDLFFVGDGHQRIYPKHRAVLGQCGIDIRGRARKLYLNYRTTDEIRKVAVALLEGREIDDLDGGSDENRRYKSLSHGPSPERLTARSNEEAVEIAVATVTNWLATDANAAVPSICVMARTSAIRDQVAHKLRAKGTKVSAIDADSADSGSTDAVRVSTMHRAKGLEFDRVVVLAPGLSRVDEDSDLPQLVYVSMTRAKAMAVLVA